MNGKEMPLVDVRNLSMHFRVGHRPYLIAGPKPRLRAVDGVSLSIYRGEIVGLVGESGCGKSTLGQAILQLYRPTGGDVFYDGVNLVELNSSRLRPIRRRMQIVFQDPFASLDPRMTVGQAVGEPLVVQGTAKGRKEVRERTDEALRTVGLLRGCAIDIPTSLALDNGSASQLPVPLSYVLSSWFWTSRSPQWTCPSRPRS